jgi:hypothetical protein
VAATVLMVLAAVARSGAASTYSIRDYFPLQPDSTWVLVDVDGEPADDEGFSWTVLGGGPQTIGAHQAWAIGTDTVSPADPREGDRLYWNTFGAGADLGLYGVYENAGATPLAGNQTIAFGQPLRVGAERMSVGWSDTTTASATFSVTVFGRTFAAPGTATATAAVAQHRDQLDTPLGTFYDVLVLTLNVNGTASLFGLPVFQGPLFQGTLFLARSVGLVRFTRALDPYSPQAQAIASGLLAGVPIAPPPPPLPQGVTVDAPDRLTGENGDTARFTVVLDAAPVADVALTLSCDDPTEASLATGRRSLGLVFTPTDWDVPQAVSLVGLDDPDWDGHQTYQVTFAIESADPAYAVLDPTPWTLTCTNLDNESMDIADYFILLPGSHWRYVPYDEAAGTVVADIGYVWSVEETQPLMHGVPVTAIRTDLDQGESPLNGAANFWSLDAGGALLLHGVRLPVPIERDIEYLGGTYHVVVPAQTIEFAAPLVAGTRGMVAHQVLSGSTSAVVEVTGLPLITSLPIQISSHVELLGLRERKRTPCGTFLRVPYLQMLLSIRALGESVQDQGGVLFLARGTGVIGQNLADQPDAPVGMGLAAGTAGTVPIVPDEPDDGLLSIALPLRWGWNLVSVPFEPLDPSPRGLFGEAILGHTWELRAMALTPATRIVPGCGYWVYRSPTFAPGLPTAEVLVRGTPAPRTTRDARRGWILAGPITPDPAAVLPLPLLSAAPGTPVCRLAWVWQEYGLAPVQEVPAGLGAWFLVESAGPVELAPTP